MLHFRRTELLALRLGMQQLLGLLLIAEIQFADYIYLAFDQIVNEMAKFRFRRGNQWIAGGTTLHMSAGAVGHGGKLQYSTTRRLCSFR
jgi:pyruvate/2-oxoglutarate/acetoin dehydrogenase E1 component